MSLYNDQVNITAVNFYVNGRTASYIQHDPITDQKTLIVLDDLPTSPLLATAEILNGFLHGVAETYDTEKGRVIQQGVYDQHQLITLEDYKYKKTKSIEGEKIKRKRLTSRTTYDYKAQKSVTIDVLDVSKSTSIFKETITDMTDQSVIAQKSYPGILINNIPFALHKCKKTGLPLVKL